MLELTEPKPIPWFENFKTFLKWVRKDQCLQLDYPAEPYDFPMDAMILAAAAVNLLVVLNPGFKVCHTIILINLNWKLYVEEITKYR